jgi:cell division protein FtsI (penicillin-binding protein 3)
MLSFGQQFRTRVIYIALFCGLALMLIRLFDLQCLRFEKYRDKALRQHKSRRIVRARRGRICDRTGVIFAITSTQPAVWSDPSKVESFVKTAVQLERIINIPKENIFYKLKNPSSPEYMMLSKKISDAQAITLRTMIKKGELPGIYIKDLHSRLYPKHDLLGNIIGFCNADGKGAEGLEFQAERYLAGIDGFLTARKDNYKRRFFNPAWFNLQLEPEDGQDIFLTIDEYIQHVAQTELLKTVKEYSPRKAVVVVMKPKTGEILAMAQWPFFDPNDLSQYNPEMLRNMVVSEVYEPGSTMKVISGAIALNEKVVTLTTNIFCENGYWQISRRRRLRDDHPMGLISFKEVIQKSSNIGIAKAMQPVDKYTYYDYLINFGFGTKTGMKMLPGESAGLLRRPSQWTAHSKISLPMGQEIGVTPLQLLNAVSTIANRGTRMEPTLIKRITMPDGTLSPEAKKFNYFEPKVTRPNVITPDTAEKIIKAMVSVVDDDGTGRRAAISGYSIAGKTGTAQKFDVDSGHYSSTNYVSSFVGFVPASDPAISCIVVFDSPRKAHYGGTIAAPVFKRVCEETLAYLEVPKDISEKESDVTGNNTVETE